MNSTNTVKNKQIANQSLEDSIETILKKANKLSEFDCINYSKKDAFDIKMHLNLLYKEIKLALKTCDYIMLDKTK